jgi:hypothetical protein
VNIPTPDEQIVRARRRVAELEEDTASLLRERAGLTKRPMTRSPRGWRKTRTPGLFRGPSVSLTVGRQPRSCGLHAIVRESSVLLTFTLDTGERYGSRVKVAGDTPEDRLRAAYELRSLRYWCLRAYAALEGVGR